MKRADYWIIGGVIVLILVFVFLTVRQEQEAQDNAGDPSGAKIPWWEALLRIHWIGGLPVPF